MTRPDKLCGFVGCAYQALSNRHTYCGVHVGLARKSGRRDGYGAMHRRIREGWLPRVRAGGVLCARCNLPIEPDEPWDIGHDDVDRRRYWGPEHRACNRATAGRRVQSQEW